MRITQVSSGFTTTQTLTSAPAAALCAAAGPMPNGRLNPSASPPPRGGGADDELAAREIRGLVCGSSFSWRPPQAFASGRCAAADVHRRADALVGAAAADVGHRRVDVGVARLRVLPEQRRRRHDLARLAVAALRHVELRPGLLHRVRAVARQALDGDDPVGRPSAAHRHAQERCDLAVDVHGAGAALRDAAAVLGAGEPDLLAQGDGPIIVLLPSLGRGACRFRCRLRSGLPGPATGCCGRSRAASVKALVP